MSAHRLMQDHAFERIAVILPSRTFQRASGIVACPPTASTCSTTRLAVTLGQKQSRTQSHGTGRLQRRHCARKGGARSHVCERARSGGSDRDRHHFAGSGAARAAATAAFRHSATATFPQSGVRRVRRRAIRRVRPGSEYPSAAAAPAAGRPVVADAWQDPNWRGQRRIRHKRKLVRRQMHRAWRAQ